MLNSLVFVDEVHSFNSDEELENLIKSVSPHKMIVGEEYRGKDVIGYRPSHMVLEFFPKIDGYSTTNTVQHTTPR